MSALGPIMIKEFLHIVRDRRSLGVALVLPFLMVVLFGYAINFDVKHITVALIDRDGGPAARDLMEHLTADGAVEVVARPTDEAGMERLLDEGTARIGIVVPPGFEAGLAAGERVPVQVLVDGADASFAAQAMGHVSGSLRTYVLREVAGSLRTAGRREALPSLVAEPRVFFNEALDGQWFIVPGLIVIISMMLSAFLTSLCVAREYERNTIEQILVSPVSGPALMIGKLAPYLVVGTIQMVSVTIAAHVLFGVPIRGSLLFLSVSCLLFLVGAQALGLFLSSAMRSQQVAMQMSVVITVLPSILLSGFVFPIRNMPWVLQILSWVVPARYFVRIVRGVFLKGVGPDVLWPELTAMVVFATVMIAAATSRFRRSLS